MSKQVKGNPTRCKEIGPLDVFSVIGTGAALAGASGTLVLAVNQDATARMSIGDSFILHLNCSGYSGGFQNNKEYWVTSGLSSGRIPFAQYENGPLDVSASGLAGSGVVYPYYRVGGVLRVGTSGDLYLRGIEASESNGGSGKPVLHMNQADGSTLPFMIKDVSASGTTASNLVAWEH